MNSYKSFFLFLKCILLFLKTNYFSVQSENKAYISGQYIVIVTDVYKC